MLDEIKQWLSSLGISYQEVHHQPTRTSEEAARARGVDLSIGGKALVIKIDDSFKLFVLSAAKQLDSGTLKKHFHAKKIRFADPEELSALTGLVPGSVPPFGMPLLELEVFVDESITNNEKIAFNAGSLTDSIIMSIRDYIKAAKPTILRFSK